jgi:hypothetical protein
MKIRCALCRRREKLTALEFRVWNHKARLEINNRCPEPDCFLCCDCIADVKRFRWSDFQRNESDVPF